MKTLQAAKASGEQLHGQPRGCLINNGGRVLTSNITLGHGTSHLCKDKWRTRANAKDLVVVRKVHH